MMIQPIVEGHGEVQSVPVLLRRLLSEGRISGINVGRPIRQPRTQLVLEQGITRAVRVALLQEGCCAILIVIDANSDCPGELGPTLQAFAKAVAHPTPCAVVLAHREFEAWFLASLESLRGTRRIRGDASPPPDPELHRGAKEILEANMQPGHAYHPTVDQPALTARFDLACAYSRSRSFRRMVRAVGQLVVEAGVPIDRWPPAGWTPL